MSVQEVKPLGHCGAAKYFEAALVVVTRYIDNNELALVSSPGTPDQQVYSVNLPDTFLSKDCVWLKDWSENEGVADALIEAGLVELTGRVTPTGFVEAKEAKLLW